MRIEAHLKDGRVLGWPCVTRLQTALAIRPGVNADLTWCIFNSRTYKQFSLLMEFMLPEILDMPWAVWPWEVDVVLGGGYGK